MEPRFGHDFSAVRVHSDRPAAEAASALSARAFTSGTDIVFGAGEYAARSYAGRRLLAHELTHVVQQRQGVRLSSRIGRPGDAYERSADKVADRVASGGNAGSILGDVSRRVDCAFAAPASGRALQLQFRPKKDKPRTFDPSAAFQTTMSDWAAQDKLKAPITEKLAKAFVKRPNRPQFRQPMSAEEATLQQLAHLVPSEKEVYNAIYSTMKLKRIGNLYSADGWKLEPPQGKEKTLREKTLEVGKHVLGVPESLEDYADDVVKAGVETGVELLVELSVERSLLVTAAFLSGALEVYAAYSTVVGLIDLVKSLGSQAELSAADKKTADIVGDVKDWLEGNAEEDKVRAEFGKPKFNEAKMDNTQIVHPAKSSWSFPSAP